MGKLPLTLACGDYDRTRALADGTVTAEGIELNCVQLPVEEIFYRMARHREFDVAELSLSSYLMTLDEDGVGPFVALPIFPSRGFRHGGIYINEKSKIQNPADLAGKTVGVPEYQVTAAVWIRGILAEHHAVPVESVHYRTGGIHEAGRIEKVAFRLPDGVDCQPIGPGQTLSEMLVSGEIDALYSPRTPRSFIDRASGVRRLFTDLRAVESGYFRTTGIFPIMHVVAIRRERYEQDRWIARSLQKAFEAALEKVMTDIDETAALRYTLPWLVDDVEYTRSVMGDRFWTYGLHGNEHAIETLIGYSHSQGLAKRAYPADELFAPEALDGFLI